MSVSLHIQPITYREACEFILQYHRHHKPPQGCKFCIACADESGVRGVVVVGRPVARRYDDSWTAEVTRCCTDGASNACSLLYGAAWRAAKAMGYRRLITYTKTDEPGTSLLASGWSLIAERKARSWANQSRHRVDKTAPHARYLWERTNELLEAKA